MRSFLLALALLAPAADALASSCSLGPFIQTQTPSLQCDIVMYRIAGYTENPKLHVRRDGVWVDVTGDVQKTEERLWVSYEELGCNGEVVATNTSDTMFDVYRIKTTAQLGEQIHIDGIVLNPLTDAACEPVTAPDLSCPLTAYPCEEANLGDDIVDAGCSTTGSSSAWVALALLGLLARRRAAASRAPRKIEVSGGGTSTLHGRRA